MKLNVKRKPSVATILLLMALGVTTSCIDSSYDLDKDVDLTINVGGEYLAIPVGETEQITLDKIIELEEGDDLQIVNGEYHLIKNGTIEDAKTTVKGVEVEKSENEIGAIEVITKGTPNHNGTLSNPDIYQEGKVTIRATGIDEAIKRIGRLDARTTTTLWVELKLVHNLSGYQSFEAELAITLPDFLQFIPNPLLTGNVLKLKLQDTDFDNGVYQYPLELTGYSIEAWTEAEQTITDGEFFVEREMSITGMSEVTVSGNSPIPDGESLQIVPKIIIDPMTIASIRGMIQPEIEEVGSTVELTDLPDFLQDDETELDIENPIITLIARNPLDIPIELNGVLVGEKNGETIPGSEVTIGKNGTDGTSIELKPGENIIALSCLGSGGSQGAENVKVSDLNQLIKKVPDVVSVTLQPAVESEEYYTVELQQEYAVRSSYDIDVPLSFGNNLRIVYEEEVNDFDLDLDDIDIRKVVLDLTADNTIPLQMEIKNENVTVVDKNGNELKGIKTTVSGTITESKDGKTVETSQLSITLEETQENVISNMDGIRFKVTAVSGQALGVQLLSTQWMQLKGMKLRIPNGIQVDLN